MVSKDVEEWRFFQRLRNRAFKFLEKAKRMYFIERFSRLSNIWKEFRKYKGEQDCTSPVKVIKDGKEISSPKEMNEAFNDYFIEKIEGIEEKFIRNDEDDMEILKKLVKKPEEELEVKSGTVSEVYESSNSCSFDQIISGNLKTIPEIFSLWITHL